MLATARPDSRRSLRRARAFAAHAMTVVLAVDMVEVSAAGIRVSGGAAEVSCVAAKGVASAAICSSPADAKSASKPRALSGGVSRGPGARKI